MIALDFQVNMLETEEYGYNSLCKQPLASSRHPIYTNDNNG